MLPLGERFLEVPLNIGLFLALGGVPPALLESPLHAAAAVGLGFTHILIDSQFVPFEPTLVKPAFAVLNPGSGENAAGKVLPTPCTTFKVPLLI